MSIDVEDYFHTQAMSQAVARDHWSDTPSRVVANTQRLLELFSSRDIHATFFFLGWVADKFPSLVAETAAAGHEIACHSYWHRAVFSLTEDEFREDTKRAKDTIETAANCPVIGYRAPSFSITPAVPWAHEVLAELGFLYDSSTHPIQHDFYANGSAPRTPHRIAGTDLLELPITTVPIGTKNFPCGGGAYFRIFPYQYSAWALRRVNRRDRMPAMFYLHPWEIDPDQPRLAAGWKSRLRQYTQLEATWGKLERLVRDFEFASIREVFADELQVPSTQTLIAHA